MPCILAFKIRFKVGIKYIKYNKIQL
jgi:hypothetical protein